MVGNGSANLLPTMRQYLKASIKNSLIIVNHSCVLAFCILLTGVSGCNREHDTRYFCRDARFSIAFPIAWKISENQKGTRILAEIPDEDGMAVIRQNVNVVVEEVKAPVSLMEYIERQKAGLQNLRGVKILTTGKNSISGSPAEWLSYSYTINDFGYQALVYVLNKDTRFYVITGICQIGTFYKYEDRFHHIAKSFKFE